MMSTPITTYHMPGDPNFVVRLILAHVIAIFLPGVLMWCGITLNQAPAHPSDSGAQLLTLVCVSAWVTAPVMVLRGMPFHGLCRIPRWYRWPVFLVDGATIGVGLTPLVIGLVYGRRLLWPALAYPFTGLGLFFGLCGATAAYGFGR